MRSSRQVRAIGRVTILMLLSALSAGKSFGQSSWDRYKPGTLAAVMREGDSTIRAALRETDSVTRGTSGDKKPSEHFLGYDYPTLATVVYKGDSRQVDPIRRGLIAAWGLTYRRDSSIVADFNREYLFQEGDKLLWLPVQDRVASFFPKELRPGQRVRLYTMLLGGYYADGGITWAFIVNEFKAGPITQ
jgi:hypothetical protein